MTDYSRQSVLDQESISGAMLTIAGLSPIANFFLLYCHGLGVGHMRLIDSSLAGNEKNEFLLGKGMFRFLKKERKTDLIQERLSRINSDVFLDTFCLNLEKSILGYPDVLLDLTNSQTSKRACLEHALDHNIPMISCSSSQSTAAISCFNPKARGRRLFLDTMLLEDYSMEGQGSFTSAIIAAIALDETRKFIAPLDDDRNISGRLDYSLYHPARLTTERQKPSRRKPSAPGSALVVGAGGIGTYAALCLALMGTKVTVYDNDIVEESNLNRQVFYTSHVGENKALSLKQELKGLGEIDARPELFTYKDGVGFYPIVLCCVDSWDARKVINEKCVDGRVPMLNGSVTAFSSRVDGYSPLHPCLECKYDFDALVRMQSSRGCCTAVQESNIVMTNALTGAMMAAEASLKASGTASKDLEYFSNPGLRGRFRVSSREQKGGCKCTSRRWTDYI